MNFYKRFIGDIQAKTGHLSLAEFGAYDRLLDHCYSTERPLPLDLDACCRIARAMGKDERKAVESVLAQFFIQTNDGYIQTRVIEMLAEAKPKIEASRANGKLGGRPKKNQFCEETETQEKPGGFSEETEIKPSENLSQSQSQISPSLRSGDVRASRLPTDWVLPDDWRQWARAERSDMDLDRAAASFADYWHGKAGKDGRKADWAATWRNWVRNERSIPPSRASPQPKHAAAARAIFGAPHPEIVDV